MMSSPQHTRSQFYVSDRDIDNERIKGIGISKEKAFSRIITRRALQEHIQPYGCIQLGRDERGRIFEVSGHKIPRKMKPRKFSRSVLIKRRMHSIINSHRSTK